LNPLLTSSTVHRLVLTETRYRLTSETLVKLYQRLLRYSMKAVVEFVGQVLMN
jgi:hypothetical protein